MLCYQADSIIKIATDHYALFGINVFYHPKLGRSQMRRLEVSDLGSDQIASQALRYTHHSQHQQ